MKIRIAIVGYGNLGRGVESAVNSSEDMELVALFTRRPPEAITTKTNVPVYHIDDAIKMKDNIDVMVICGGSAKDLPEQTPELAKYFNVIDSFDTHARIPEHFERVNSSSISGDKISLISAGWDPGMFSINRLISQAVLPNGKDYTFWGRGVSQGHSDAIRKISGVVDARQYTVPVESAVSSVRNGEEPELSTRQKHTRECFVVAEAEADLDRIRNEIVTMPNYFADYDTTVNFITQEELDKTHKGIPHGGMVIRSGKTGFDNEHSHIIEYKLTLDSNPEFTSSVLTAYARAIYRMYKDGMRGCKTVFDVAPAYLHPSSNEELRKNLL